MSKKVLNTIMIVFYCVMFFFLASPIGQPLIDRIEPHILGLPCYQAWILYGSFLMALGLIVWYIADSKIEDRENIEVEKTEEGGESR